MHSPRHTLVTLLAAATILTATLPAPAQGGGPLLYKPPMRGAPATRVGASSRGVGDANLLVAALVPNHTGFAATPQPTFYWYAASPPRGKVTFTLTSQQRIDPLVERPIRVRQGGVQAIELKDFGVRLESGLEYEWYVSLVKDDQVGSGDVVVGGTVQYVPPGGQVAAALAAAPAGERTVLYAQHGYWYAVLEQLMGGGTGRTPGEMPSLLRQVELDEVAADLERR